MKADNTATDNPAPTFALFAKDAAPTEYSIHWAVAASNGNFSGSLGTVKTAAEVTTGTTHEVGYFGWGGMEFHMTTDFTLPTMSIIAKPRPTDTVLLECIGFSEILINRSTTNPAIRNASNHSEVIGDAVHAASLPVLFQDTRILQLALSFEETDHGSLKLTLKRTGDSDIVYKKTPIFE